MFFNRKPAMKADSKRDRRAQIETAAYDILEEKGFAGASMLSIAKRAKCSNETLYNWYGDKTGLFRDLIDRNAAEARVILEEALSTARPPLQALDAFGPVLLSMLTAPRAVALNRAAAAEPTGALGAVLSEAGRSSVLPILSRLLEAAQQAGELGKDDPKTLAETYLGLLIGDLQIRCVVAREMAPPSDELQTRAIRASAALRRLFPPKP